MTDAAQTDVDIFAFISYRSYLEAVASQWTRHGGSMQALARQLGFTSPNFVQQIVAGKRNLTEQAALKAASGLGLAENERRYLLALVRLTRAKDPGETSQIMLSMKRLVGRARRRQVVDSSIFDHWLYGVVFEMFKLERVSNEQDLAAARLRIGVTAAQLGQAFTFLTQRGYLVRSQDRWVPAKVDFQPQNDVRRINSQQNHLKFLTQAQHRLSDELFDREFQGLTFAVKEARFTELKERIRAFIRAVDEEFAEDEGGDQVLRLQLGLFKILK
jgi:uncharacterized protein (TIGR02147 family)